MNTTENGMMNVVEDLTVQALQDIEFHKNVKPVGANKRDAEQMIEDLHEILTVVREIEPGAQRNMIEDLIREAIMNIEEGLSMKPSGLCAGALGSVFNTLKQALEIIGVGSIS